MLLRRAKWTKYARDNGLHEADDTDDVPDIIAAF